MSIRYSLTVRLAYIPLARTSLGLGTPRFVLVGRVKSLSTRRKEHFSWKHLTARPRRFIRQILGTDCPPSPMKKYPQNWRKISRTLRRIYPRCASCGETKRLSVHHTGAAFPDRSGDWHDKHDLRVENLQVLCWSCHCRADRILSEQEKRERKRQARQRKAARRRHRALNIGTGLVLVE